MENYSDLVSSIVLGSFLVAIIIPLIGFLRHTNKERQKLDEVKSVKKPETPQSQKELLYH